MAAPGRGIVLARRAALPALKAVRGKGGHSSYYLDVVAEVERQGVDNQPRFVKAAKGVVLATGGFVFNEAMRRIVKAFEDRAATLYGA